MNNLEITLNGKTHVIAVRAKDGYLNATQLCKVGNKLFANYMQNNSTSEYHNYLVLNIGFPIVKLIESTEGRYGGTWVHKKVAYHIASWVSPVFMDQLITVYDKFITGDLSLVRDVVKNHDTINHTQSTVLIQTQELDLLERKKKLEMMDLEISERKTKLDHEKVRLEERLDALDASGVNAYKSSIDLIKEHSTNSELNDTDKRFYKDLIKNNNARRSTLLALESKEAYEARKERFLLPVSDLYKQVTGRAGNSKIWMALGKELAHGYRLKHDGKEPLKTESYVNGVTRMINAYNMRDDPWIEEYAIKIINANKSLYN